MSVYIGIDPDTAASGVAFYCANPKMFILKRKKFFELFDYLRGTALKLQQDGNKVMIIIEAGWLKKKSNWHGSTDQTKRAGEKISKNVGSNHETGRKIAEMCEYLGLPYELQLPMGKMNPQYFFEMTGQKVTDQDLIDAGCLVFGR